MRARNACVSVILLAAMAIAWVIVLLSSTVGSRMTQSTTLAPLLRCSAAVVLWWPESLKMQGALRFACWRHDEMCCSTHVPAHFGMWTYPHTDEAGPGRSAADSDREQKIASQTVALVVETWRSPSPHCGFARSVA